MRVLILFAALAVANAYDQCAWGESYWCSGLKQAKECGAFQHCMTTVWRTQELAVDSGELCQYCESVVKDVKSFITDKQTQAQIKQYLDSACSIIPDAELAKECQDLVNNNLQAVLDLITSELDPQMVCSVMGLCAGLKDRVQHFAPLKRVPTMKIPAVQMEPICTDCKKFMQDIKDLVTSKTTEQELEQMIEQQLCSQLGQFQDECKALVEAYVPELMELLTSEFDPNMICSMAGFCNATGCPKAMLAKMRLRKSPLFQEVRQVSDSAECEICKTILGEIQALDRTKSVQQEVEAFLKENICAKLGTFRGACEQTVDQYAPELFELIATELDPNTRCQAIGFCSTPNWVTPLVGQSRPQKPVPAQEPLRASTQCVMCEFVMRELESVLEDNATQAEIMAALEKVCSLLPSTISKECTDFVDTYGPAVIALLEQELDPKQICTILGLCKAARTQAPRVGASELCGVCETLIGYLDSLLEQNATVKEIEAALEKVCNFLPDPYRNECDTIVETYGPTIIQLLSQFADPNEICTAIGLCGNTTKKEVEMSLIQPAKAQLLGVNECTYGPAFWCLSRANAEKCKVVDHCSKHVWKN